MKLTHYCTKCGSEDVLLVEAKSMGYGSGNFIPMGLSIWSAVPVDRYVCATCGFAEEWIPLRHLKKLKDKYSD